jgi:hypothetical protein
MRPVPSLILSFAALLSVFCGSASAVSQIAELTEATGTVNDDFGSSVAVTGDTMVIGAPGAVGRNGRAVGAAYVFVNTGAGWGEAARLTTTNQTGLGTSVALSADGRTIAVGAPQFGKGGAVFVYVEPTSGWVDTTQTAELRPQHAVNEFGVSVALSADGKVVIGGSQGGGAFVFAEAATGWADMNHQTASLAAPTGAERFGLSVAVDGDVVVVGDPQYLDASNQSTGGAFVYILRAGPHTIPISAALTASDAGVADNFGASVSISGSTVVSGAYGHNSLAGAAYIFVRPSGGWTSMTQTAELTLPPSVQATLVGYSVAIAGNTILAGAPRDTIGDNSSQGAVFAYVKPPGGWVNTSMPNLSVTGSDSTVNDEFGYSVALSGTTAVIGAPFHTVNGNVDQGAAYVFGAK